MKFLRNMNNKVLSVALATAMAFGFAAAPVPALLEVEQSVVKAAEVGDPEVTVLPDPDKSGDGGGTGGGQSQLLKRVQSTTTIYDGQTISNNGIVLIGFNKNVTKRRNREPFNFDAIDKNWNKVIVVPENSDNPLVYGEKVPQILIDYKNENDNTGDPYNQDSYRNYIYLNTTSLPAGSYRVKIKTGVFSANGEYSTAPDEYISFNIQ